MTARTVLTLKSVEPLIKIKISKLGGETGFRIRSHSTLSRPISVNHRVVVKFIYWQHASLRRTSDILSGIQPLYGSEKKNRKCHLFDARCIWLSVFYLKSVWWCYCFLFLLLETWCVLILQMENLNGNTITREVQGKLATFQMWSDSLNQNNPWCWWLQILLILSALHHCKIRLRFLKKMASKMEQGLYENAFVCS